MKIELIDVCCGYEKKDILKDLNFTCETGNFYCILGANGIGKTTLFKTLLGFINPKKGQIIIDGHDLSKMSSKELARYISYVPQAKNNSYLYSVLDIVLMGRSLYINKFSSPSKNDMDITMKVLEQLDIVHLKDKMYSELSGGEQQIVLIARALVQEAKFIVMDEPTSNLDFENQKKVLHVLNVLAKNSVGIIMSSHSPDHAFYCNAKAILILKDKTVLEGPCETIITEDNLLKVYGVNIKVIKQQDQNKEMIRCCCLS